MEGNFFFCRTSPLKMFHEFILGSQPILIEQNLRKKYANLRLLFFLCFSYNYAVKDSPTITTDLTTKLHP